MNPLHPIRSLFSRFCSAAILEPSLTCTASRGCDQIPARAAVVLPPRACHALPEPSLADFLVRPASPQLFGLAATHITCSLPVLRRSLPLIVLRMVVFPIAALLVAWAAPGTALASILPVEPLDSLPEFAAHVVLCGLFVMQACKTEAWSRKQWTMSLMQKKKIV